MLYNRCTGICKFGNNTYPQRIRRRSNLGYIFQGKKCVLWARKCGNKINLLLLVHGPFLAITSMFVIHINSLGNSDSFHSDCPVV